MNVSSSSPSSTAGVFRRMERIACVAHAFWIICAAKKRLGLGLGLVTSYSPAPQPWVLTPSPGC